MEKEHKLGVCTWMFGELPLSEIAGRLEKLGFSRTGTDSCVAVGEMITHSTFGQRLRHHWLGSFVLKHRYLALAVLFNLPGNYFLGGGGGIALVCGASRCIPRKTFLLTVVLATSPVPLLAFFGLIQLETLLQI